MNNKKNTNASVEDSIISANILGDKTISDFLECHLNGYIDFVIKIKDLMKKNGTNLKEYQDSLNRRTYDLVKKGHELETSISGKTTIAEVKKITRQRIYGLIQKSIIMKRALQKPRGYPGDYQMLEYIYDNKPLSKGIGLLYDVGFLESDLTEAVRNRKNMMKEMLRDLISSKKGKEPVRILDLASGSCREVRELIAERYDLSMTEWSFFDQDKAAIDFAKKTLGKSIKSSFYQGNIIELVNGEGQNILDNKDIIYSIGLIDYLPDRIMRKMIQTIYGRLKPGGGLVISHKDHERYLPIREDWLSDWKFVPRDEKRLREIVLEAGIDPKKIRLLWEPRGIIFFYVIEK